MRCTTFRYISSKSAGTPANNVGFTSAMRSRMRRRSFSKVTSPPTTGATTAATVNGKAWCIDLFGSGDYNAADLPDDVKVKLQTYVSGCYGSLTSFNVLFADEEDHFKGSGGD